MKSAYFRNVVLTVVLVALAAAMLAPFVWMLSLAFKSNMEIISGDPSFLPSAFSLDGFHAVQEKANLIVIWFKNSVMVTASILILSLFASALVGYIFAKFRFRGSAVMFILLLAGLMVPFQVTMIPVYLIMKELDLLNNLSAIILPAIVNPFGIFLCKQFVENVPNDMIEAGRVDGAGEWYTFFRLIVPQIVPALSALAIFGFIATWNDYLWPLIVLDEQVKMTLPIALKMFGSAHTTDYNATMAIALIAMVPSFILFLLFQKQFIKGAALSGMK